jgi:NAD(P)-dependent dehydrogenase (short-subunit alcohol dehydrogenase family)
MFQDKVIVITGGASGIGKCIAAEFSKQGAIVCVIDCAPGDHYVGDISRQDTLEAFADVDYEEFEAEDAAADSKSPWGEDSK